MGAALLLAVVVAALLVVGWIYNRRWQADRRELARIQATFARYVSPAVVDQIVARRDHRILTGRAARATILVCRIRNFAHFAEDLEPQQTLRYLNDFYAVAGSTIQKYRGTIESLLGDGIVGVFGVPLDDPIQEDNATRAALDIVRLVQLLRERWAAQNVPGFDVGIGINTGMVIAGDTGFKDRREYAVVGAAATLAHRLQAATEDVNAYILASKTTCDGLGNDYILVPLQSMPLRGLRRLAEASIVRGRRGADPALVLPRADAFVRTEVETPAPEPPEAPAAAIPAPPPPEPPSSSETAREYVAGDPFDDPYSGMPRRSEIVATGPARPRSRVVQDVVFPHVDTSDTAHAALPDPPPARATYEDDDGPPLPL